MLTDRSPNYVETWRFLERRISDILKYGQTINTVKNLVVFVSLRFLNRLEHMAVLSMLDLVVWFLSLLLILTDLKMILKI